MLPKLIVVHPYGSWVRAEAQLGAAKSRMSACDMSRGSFFMGAEIKNGKTG